MMREMSAFFIIARGSRVARESEMSYPTLA